MYRSRLDQYPKRRAILHWFLLSFNGGCINAGAFLTTGRFVTHVTGFATLFGVNLANRDVDLAISMLSVPVFFLLGAMIAGLLIDGSIHRKQLPHYDYVMGLCSLCLFTAGLVGRFDRFGSLGLPFHLDGQYPLLALLCLASGLQNGALTTSSGSSVRTTHMTGLTTDLGLGIALMLTYTPHDDVYRRERVANLLRLGTVLSFIVGSEVGAILFIGLGYRGFLISSAIAAYAAWHGRLFKHAAHRPDGFALSDVPKLT
ncbi:MAG: YoaK family protein [Elusimicrobiota bacterium]